LSTWGARRRSTDALWRPWSDCGEDHHLAGEAGLSGPDYDVLSHVSESPGRRARLGELAERMAWSKSRLSHHLTRMERRGLATRQD
jgi:DNA-binding MarR family transcriptional regulator